MRAGTCGGLWKVLGSLLLRAGTFGGLWKVLGLLLLQAGMFGGLQVDGVGGFQGRILELHSVVIRIKRGCTVATILRWQGCAWCKHLDRYGRRNEAMGGGTQWDQYTLTAKRELSSADHRKFVRDEGHLNCLEASRDDSKRPLLQAHVMCKYPALPGGHTRSLVDRALDVVCQATSNETRPNCGIQLWITQ